MIELANSLENKAAIVTDSVDLCLLLTATIDPEGMILTERNNPKERLEDYKKALIFWLGVKGIRKIVFCENSNSDLAALHKIEKIHNHQGKEVEFISFYGQDFPKHLGKGYGELRIIAHALNQSKLIDAETSIIKVTGRYIVKNADELIDFSIAHLNADIICDLSRGLSWSDSRILTCSTRFAKHYLIPMQEHINDSAGINFEKALAMSVHRAMGEGLSWVMPPSLPEISGIFGTKNVAYKRFFIKDALRRVVYSLKRYFFALSN